MPDKDEMIVALFDELEESNRNARTNIWSNPSKVGSTCIGTMSRTLLQINCVIGCSLVFVLGLA